MTLQNFQINEFGELASQVSELPPRESIAIAVRKYDYVIQHTFDGVEILDAKSYSDLPADFLELRSFNKDGELHAIDVNGELHGRVIVDKPGSDSMVFDEEHLIWGRLAQEDDECYVLTEERGTQVRMPKSALQGMNEKKRATIRVRNYLEEGGIDPETGDTRFAFSDYRFVCFGVRDGE